MPDWTKSMEQTYEYYIVDPITWKDKTQLNTVMACTIDRDSTAETLGSATIDITDSVGECYIRAYLITIQNGVTEKHPFGTFLVQTPSTSYNGKIRSVSMDAYTPLLELKENPPEIGYSIFKPINDNEKIYILDQAYKLAKNNMRGPVIKPTIDTTVDQYKNLVRSDFVANVDDTWLSFIATLLNGADYKFDVDELGRTFFAKNQKTETLQPIWTYTDDNSSILLPDLDMDHDIFGVPNRVVVVYSSNGVTYRGEATNEDENSPTSYQRRGRWITKRVVNPDFGGIPIVNDAMNQVQEYAETLLKESSTLEYTVTYSHGYCPVRVGDCVRLNYTRAGLTDIKAKVIKQSISCVPGCTVTETAVFTNKLWR